jgi:hypothetical protein
MFLFMILISEKDCPIPVKISLNPPGRKLRKTPMKRPSRNKVNLIPHP